MYMESKYKVTDDIASLRLKVFKDFPYLYDGNIEYEHKYLERYSLSK